MNASNAISTTSPQPELPESERRGRPAILRGGPRGLEAVVDGGEPGEVLVAALIEKLAEAPAFFRGNVLRIRVENGPLAPGALGALDVMAAAYQLRIVEIGAWAPPPKRSPAEERAASEPQIPVPAIEAPPPPAEIAAGTVPPEDVVTAIEIQSEPETKMVCGPIRSGVVLHHPGTLVIIGDVNPGAEVRAVGNIIVLGRLRGMAHAGIGRDGGFIFALRLEPQQIRICRQVARSGDSDAPVTEPEIAYMSGGAIVVERYQGRLPRNLATSI